MKYVSYHQEYLLTTWFVFMLLSYGFFTPLEIISWCARSLPPRVHKNE